MFGWFNKDWKVIGTIPFQYSNMNGEVVFLMSATFYMGKNDSRKVELDFDKFYKRIYSPWNHPFYHNFCVPFIHKSGIFAASNEVVTLMIKALETARQLEESQQLRREADKIVGKQNLKKLLNDAFPIENVVKFPVIKKDNPESEA